MDSNYFIRKSLVYLTIVVVMFGFLVSDISAQTKFDIQINSIDRTIYKNFLGIPKTVDYRIFWTVLELQDGQYVNTNLDKLNDYKVIYTAGDSTFMQAQTIKVAQTDSSQITGLKVGEKYFFKVQAVDSNNQIYESQVAMILSGRQVDSAAAVDQDEEFSWLWYLPINGRFPLTFLGYGNVFDKATILGKFAFHVIWWFFLFGVLIIGYCFYNLTLSRVFPFTPATLKTAISPLNFESQFQSRKADNFFGESGIIMGWKRVIESVEKLFEKPPKMEGDKTLDIDKLRIESATFWRDIGRKEIKKLQVDIREFEKYSTARIIRAGLANHESNGFKFMTASQEVDRAIENRAMMEREQLKGKTKIEWLWNLSATAPLVGLFGTVTGISMSFQKLAVQSERGIIDTSSKITELAGGINEALWTTIFGLTIGIVLVLFYYFFKNKMDWIYGKWEEIYVDVSEKL